MYIYPDKPKLITLEMLPKLQEQFSENIFYVADVAELFSITAHNAAVRLMRLKNFGLVRYAELSNARKGYYLTAYGIRFRREVKDEDTQSSKEK